MYSSGLKLGCAAILNQNPFFEIPSRYLSTRGVSPEIVRHSCEGRYPENAVSSELDARLRGHDIKNTPTPQKDIIL